MDTSNTKNEVAIFGGGCFWCTEAAFVDLKGVFSVLPGYAGGETEKPTYSQVCGGQTGHAEVARVEFDPTQISYHDLLSVFFTVHDPTTVNRQGNDTGTQYRSIILFTTPEQEREAREFMQSLTNEKVYSQSIVTELKPLAMFYEAEDYHRNYYKNNEDQPYCQAIINPKLKKLKAKYGQLLKPSAI